VAQKMLTPRILKGSTSWVTTRSMPASGSQACGPCARRADLSGASGYAAGLPGDAGRATGLPGGRGVNQAFSVAELRALCEKVCARKP
jgi:hypothetical protein